VDQEGSKPTLKRLTLSALIILVLALVVSNIAEAKPRPKQEVRRLSKYACDLNIGEVRECKTKKDNSEVELKELTGESVLAVTASWRNSTDLDLCASIDNPFRFEAVRIGPEIFISGDKQDYGYRISLTGIEPGETLEGIILLNFEEC